MLGSCDVPLAKSYDLAISDLDGVVYLGKQPVVHAVDSLNAAQDAGMRVGFLTNNASRPTEVVAEQLQGLGLHTTVADVVNSAQAAAALLTTLVPAGAPVFCLGGAGLEEALAERGLVKVTERGHEVAAVVQGYGPDVPWHRVMLGARLVASGLPWVATNRDMTIPTADGIAPGNGALVKLVAEFAQREPIVAGKPEPAAFQETQRRLGGSRPLVIGDRLDTDIAGANNAAFDSLLVMTGVTDLETLVTAGPALRPTYLAADLRELREPQPEVSTGADGASAGGWTAGVAAGRLTIAGTGSASDWWRAVATAAWIHLDATGTPVDIGGVSEPSEGDR